MSASRMSKFFRRFLCEGLRGPDPADGERLKFGSSLRGCFSSETRPSLARSVRALGVLSAIGTLFVALNPSDRWPQFHQLAVLATTGAALAAGLGGALGLHRSERGRPLARLAATALALAAADGALYLHQVLTPGDCAVLLPVLQKLAGLAALAWMIAVAVRLVRDKPRRAPPGPTSAGAARD
jgi:hypothetical protein